MNQPRIFKSPAMCSVLELIERIASSNVPVLICGETGTGKEVVAELIHQKSPRRKQRMVSINCATLPKELIESELFGAVRGSFTGSYSDRSGLFVAADDSTLFLDELSEMPLNLQTRFLRVLQEKAVRRVGSVKMTPINVRIIASVNKLPQLCIKLGRLREDLYYRLSIVSISIPPLRERGEDIAPMANAYLDYYCTEINREAMSFAPPAMTALLAYEWPGNVRQLQNEINRLVLTSRSNTVQLTDLSGEITQSELRESTLYTMLEQQERETIITVMRSCNGNKLQACKKLGIGRQTLYNKLKAYNIESGPV
jgi:transcriptional regulator with PAS, ATPase and Fis domain